MPEFSNYVEGLTAVVGALSGDEIVPVSKDGDAASVTSQQIANLAGGGAAASETTAGIAELATQAETNTGTDDARIVTPLKAATRYAPKASPTFTGTPAAPTAALGTNTTQVATTAFVQQENALKSDSLLTFRTEVASHTLDATDLASINAGESLNILMNVASANDLTIPPNSTQAFPVGTVVLIDQIGAGATTLVAGAGVTLNSSDGLGVAGQYAGVLVKKIATNTWYAQGKLKL